MSSWLAPMAAALGNGVILCLEIALVVVPLLYGYELAAAYGVFNRPFTRLRPMLARLGLGVGALVPLIAGLFLGLLYGAGILLALSKEQDLPAQERLALGVFLVTCHAVVEDTAIFALLGGSAFWMLMPRVVLAVGLCLLLAKRGRVDRPSAHGL